MDASKALLQTGGGERQMIGHSMMLTPLLDSVCSFLLFHSDPDDVQVAVMVRLMQLLKRRNFVLTRRTPGSPEVEQGHPSLLFFQAYPLSLQVTKFEVG